MGPNLRDALNLPPVSPAAPASWSLSAQTPPWTRGPSPALPGRRALREALAGPGGLPAALPVLRFPSRDTPGALQAAPAALRERAALARLSGVPLTLPGLLLIDSPPSRGVVSEASWHIGVRLLLPAGRAIAWQAQGWSRRGRRRVPALPCSGPGAFLRTLRPPPST